MSKNSSKSHDIRPALHRNCQLLNIEPPHDAIDRLARFSEELIRWNKRINLTGAQNTLQFVEGPLFDAMTLVPLLADAPSFVDIGSGGGLPGIPSMILAELTHVTLVEPRAKRATFLRHINAQLQLNATIIESRIESLEPQTWASAVTQAVFEPMKWVALAPQYLDPGGFIYVLSSTPLLRPLPDGVLITLQRDFEGPKGTKRHAYRLTVS